MLQSIIQNLENQQPIVKIVWHEGTQTVTNKHNDDSETDCVWSITENVAKQRKKEPTGDVLPKRSKERRRAETLTVTSLIHGDTVVSANASCVSPAIHGMWDTITSTCNSDVVSGLVKSSKPSVKSEVHNALHDEWLSKCEKSQKNLLRSVNLYYSHDVMGKRNYISVRKETMNTEFEGKRVPNFASYQSLMDYIKSVDIGNLYDVREVFCGGIPEDEKGDGKFRKLTEFLPRLAQFYLSVNENRFDKLKEFTCFPKRNDQAFVFLLLFGGDGAPCKEGTATSFLCSFLNAGERVASSSENFLIFGANVKENGIVVRRFLKSTLQELAELESQTFTIVVNGAHKLVEFRVAELPNDMKMLAFLASELTNSASYFSTFANVTQRDSNDCSKSLTEDGSKGW